MKLFLSIIIVSILCSSGGCQTIDKHPLKKSTPDSIYTYLPRSADGTGKYYFGREISFVMGAEGAEWLDRNDRQQEENTNLAIEKMDLDPNAAVADIGAGTGYYSFAIAKKILQGKVYAVEIQDEMIKFLNEKKITSGIKNVTIIKGTNRSPNLPDSSIDLAIMVDVYHELEFPHEMLQSIKKALKDNGKILLLEYRAEDTTIAIKPHHKMTVLQANKELSANGFRLLYDGEFLPIQHFLLYQKN